MNKQAHGTRQIEYPPTTASTMSVETGWSEENVGLLHVRSSRSLNSATLCMKCFSSSSYFHDSFEVLKRYRKTVEEIKGRVRGRLNSVLQALLGSTEKLPECCLDQSWLCRPSQGKVAKQGHTAYTVVWYTHTTYTVVASNLQSTYSVAPAQW